jgi:hypothetical protein
MQHGKNKTLVTIKSEKEKREREREIIRWDCASRFLDGN